MKNLILSAVTVLLLLNNGVAQQYVPMPTNDAVWAYHSHSGGWSSDWQLMINGEDTVINAITYKKIILRSFDTDINTPEIPAGNKPANKSDRFFGGIREDNKKVYIYQYLSWAVHSPVISAVDTLYYDFNLNIGDTTPLGTIVSGIDSVLIGSQHRKRFKTHQPYDATDVEYYIEGMGIQDKGLVKVFTVVQFACNFLCFSHQGNNVAQDACAYLWPYGTTSITNNPQKEKITIYPNPFTEQLTIEDVNAKRVFIYNSTGQLVMSHVMTNNKNVIATSSLNSGVYYTILKDDAGNTIHTQKLIKQ